MPQSRRATLGTLGLIPLLLATSTVLSWAQTSASDSASTTRLVPVSGVLTDAKGSPVTGPVMVTLGLYDAQEQGTLLWTETQQVQADARGRYSAYLGVLGAVPPEVFRGEQARWLGVEVGGRELPRTMLVAVPYAIHAADAEALGGQPASSFVRSRADGKLETSAGIIVADPLVDGSGVPGQLAKWAGPEFLSSSTITETATNRIGFGLTDPTGGGVVDSVFTIRNFDNNTGFAVLNEGQQRRFAMNTTAEGAWLLYDGFGGVWRPGLRQRNGKIGIGVDPLEAVHVVQTEGGQRRAGYFEINNATSTGAAVLGITNGTAPGVRAESTNVNGLAFRAVVPATTPSTANLIIGQRGVTNVFRVHGDGGVFAPSYTTGGADFAEAMDTVDGLDRYEPGDVMVIAAGGNRTVDRAAQPYSRSVIGIYSTQPGVLASPYPVDDPRRAGKLPLAMIGIVPCKVSAENGAISRGDLLVTSSTAAHAMKGTDMTRMTGAIVGKALEPLASGTGTILVAVTLQ